MRVHRLVWSLLLTVAGAQSWSLDVTNKARFICKQGDCVNGTGTVWDAAAVLSITGEWVNAATVPGKVYTVVSPLAPTKSFQQSFGADGFLESGEQPRTLGLVGKAVPFFKGRFGVVDDPFAQQRLSVMTEGTYVTGIGIEFEGQFKFIPTKNGGFFLFFGERVDREEDERETGLFVSEETIHGTAVRFVKADPSYLSLLQEKYQRDVAVAQSDRLKAQAEFERRAESEKRWQAVFSIVGKIAMGAASGGLNIAGPVGGLGGLGSLGGLSGLSSIGGGNGAGLGGQIALGLVSAMLSTPNDSGSVEDLTRGVIGAAVSDRGAAGNLVTALLGGVAAMPAGTSPAQSSGNPIMNAMGAAVITQTGGLISSAIAGSDLGTTGRVLGAVAQQATGTLAAKVATASADGVIGGGSTAPIPPTVSAVRPSGDQIKLDPGAVTDAITTMRGLATSESSQRSSEAIAPRRGPGLGPVPGMDPPVDPPKIAPTPPARVESSKSTPVPVAPPAPAPAPAPAADSESPFGTIDLKYTPGKGFFDPIRKVFVKAPAEISCDNVTTRGFRLLDLPIDQRECRVYDPPKPVKPPGRGPNNAEIPLGTEARLASVLYIDPPEGMEFGAGTFYATNDGLYVPLVRRSDRAKYVGKYMDHSDWGVNPLGEDSTGFSPVSLDSETRNTSYFNFTYFDRRREIRRYERSGLNVQVSSPGPWMDVNADGLVFVPTFADGGGQFRYVVSGNRIWLDCNCGRYGSDGKLAYQFTGFHNEVLTSEAVGGAVFVAHKAVSNGKGGAVFVPLGDLHRLIRVHRDRFKIFDLSEFGPGIINTLVYHEGRIWVGLGSKILMIDGDKVTEVHEMTGMMSVFLPTFCIQGSTLYMASGESGTVNDLQGAGARSFLQDTPNVRIEDLRALTELKAALGTGIYCQENSSHYIYAMGVDLAEKKQRLMRIQPRPWRGSPFK